MRIFKPVAGGRTQVLVTAKGVEIATHWENGQSWFCPGDCSLCRFSPTKLLEVSVLRVAQDEHEYYVELNRDVVPGGLLIGQRLWIIGARDRNRPPIVELIDTINVRADKIVPEMRVWSLIAKLYRLKPVAEEELAAPYLARVRAAQRDRIAHFFPALLTP